MSDEPASESTAQQTGLNDKPLDADKKYPWEVFPKDEASAIEKGEKKREKEQKKKENREKQKRR